MCNDLIIIMNKYGKKMSDLCKQYFSILLEKEGLLPLILNTYFPNSNSLYDDIIKNNLEVEFKNYIYSLVDVENKEMVKFKSPKELMYDAGYNLNFCQTEDEIQTFRKYYTKDEELCTFNGDRINDCYVFFAVKKDVSNIKRSKIPCREDEYGTSVISIQFTKGKHNTVSIKNRYNHHVQNPDATFGNNLDNIIMGLTQSFENEYNLNIANNKKFRIPGYVSVKGINYKYNYKINGIYYGPDNIIIRDGKIIEEYLDKSKYFLLDYYIVNLEKSEIKLFDHNIDDILKPYIKDITNIKIIFDGVERVKCVLINGKNKFVCDINNTLLFINIKNRIIYRENIRIEKRFFDKKRKKKILK